METIAQQNNFIFKLNFYHLHLATLFSGEKVDKWDRALREPKEYSESSNEYYGHVFIHFLDQRTAAAAV
jgi:hypothetical protein